MTRSIILIALALTLISGCAESPMFKEGAAPALRVQDPMAPYATVRYNTVGIIDRSLQSINGPGKVAVEQTGARRTSTGTLEAWAMLRNRTDYPLQLEARTQFFDADRVLSDGPTAWQRIQLPPNSVDTYREFSTRRQDVAYYYVELREGR